MRPVVVLAGGLGTRLRELTGDVRPKAMVEVSGRPFIDWKLQGLAHAGVSRVIVLTGRHGDQIEQHVGTGSQYGLQVSCVHDGPQLLGTGGAIRAAVAELGESFWVTYGDTYLRVDVQAAEAALEERGVRSLMTVLRNRDEFEISNVSARDGLVVEYEKGAAPGTHEFIDYGMLLLDRDALAGFPVQAFDLSSVIRDLIAESQMMAFVVTERFYEVGTPESLRETERWLSQTRQWATITA